MEVSAMPWKEYSVPDRRFDFVAMYRTGDLSMADLCRSFCISRKTGYKLIHRFQTFGPKGLCDLSRAPHRHPNAVSYEVERAVIALRSLHPTWGPRKLLAHLARTSLEVSWPVTSTIGFILKRNGLVVPRRRRSKAIHAGLPPFAPDIGPNSVWSADFKGQFTMGDGNRCYPLTITDSFSRFILRCQGLPSTHAEGVRPIWIAAFRQYGLPAAIRTDNGAPFASHGLGGLSRLAVWWIKLGITPERIKPGCPQQNGRHERMHRTLKEEAARPPSHDMRAQQRAFDRFRHEYNHVRPHEALGQVTPVSIYERSAREYPLRLPRIEYPSSMTVRSVRTSGYVRWRGDMLFVSETLIGEPVGFDPIDDRYLRLCYGPVPLAVLDTHTATWVTNRRILENLLTIPEENL
jgi:putative transposase